ncbi:MAG: amidohydrolase [Armatimonadota bacterium]|nr:amidohydrolase [Armatimonadota bacterium]MDR7452670.1 amidohydrolase [Armatimonadota bacterium]MDR7467732.1 amidohydrolase [Armatimonadota bacterium]MDR7499803.1 amidohydrolase [Armatimonadota bacterium]MDR7505251.1 amidohydrolase [Armatimonadota bacterium]
MGGASLLIRNVTVVDPRGTGTTILPGQDILIEGPRIIRIAAAEGPPSADRPGVPPRPEPRPEAGLRVIDGTGMVALPGLINTHAHAAMVLFRGAAEDVTVERWFNEIIWPMESNLTPDDVYWGTLLAAAEMIESGVTTVADHYFLMDQVAAALLHSGLRAHLAPTLFGRDLHAELDDSARIIARYQGAGDGRIRMWLGPHSPYLCPPDYLRAVAAEAKRAGLGVHLHVSETAEQVRASLAAHGRTPPAHLAALGLMDVPVLAAHAAHATEADIALFAAHGVGVAHCPKTFLKLAAGIAPVAAMRRAGVAVGLGSDGAASNNTLDLFEQMRLAAMLQKHERRDPTILTLDDALAMATVEGARVLRQEHELGRLAPGYLADIILIRLEGVHLQPVHDIRAALVYAARPGDVDTVVVHGRVLMEGRRLQTIDKAQVIKDIAARTGRLLETSHGRRRAVYPGGERPS